MRQFMTLLSLLGLLTLCSCTSPEQGTSHDSTQQLGSVRDKDIPLPSTTPFDSKPEARAMYLEAYRNGYRSGLVALKVRIQEPAESDTVRNQGWLDGVFAGFRAHLDDKLRQ